MHRGGEYNPSMELDGKIPVADAGRRIEKHRIVITDPDEEQKDGT